MASNNRPIPRIDIIALAFFAALFVVWLYTGRSDWFRYLYLALAFLYLFVIRIVANNYRRKKEEARFDEKKDNRQE